MNDYPWGWAGKNFPPKPSYGKIRYIIARAWTLNVIGGLFWSDYVISPRRVRDGIRLGWTCTFNGLDCAWLSRLISRCRPRIFLRMLWVLGRAPTVGVKTRKKVTCSDSSVHIIISSSIIARVYGIELGWIGLNWVELSWVESSRVGSLRILSQTSKEVHHRVLNAHIQDPWVGTTLRMLRNVYFCCHHGEYSYKSLWPSNIAYD